MHFGGNIMKINELLAEEKRDTHCSDRCCGSDVKAEDCTCAPSCPHCNCNAVKETASAGGMGAGSFASSMGGGNGFANGGIGTISRAGTVNKKRKKKKQN
jgi:hypothetical protein